MGLFGTLLSASGALQAFQKALEVAQNNVGNVSTPGFAKQRLILEAMPFQAEAGLPGGVTYGGVHDFRDRYAEQAVQRRQEDYGRSDQRVADLTRLEPYFDVTGGQGFPGALDGFYKSISGWSVMPNNQVAREAVIEQATSLAARMVDTANGVLNTRAAADQEIRNTVDTINHLTDILRDLNAQLRQDFRQAEDPAFGARLNSTLEELAEYVEFTTLKQADGTTTVLLGGQTSLVLGDRQYEIHADFSSDQARITDAADRDITAQVSRGRLGGVLDVRNNTLPEFLDGLNRLAAGLADRVNAILANGVDLNGQPGAALFAYDTAENAASTLRVTNISAEELAGAAASAPGGNSNVLGLMDLVDSPQIDGASFTAYYGALARNMGQALETAQEDLKTNEQLLLQARTLRNEASGVSLDEEAVHLIEFQRAYQASAKLITVLNDLTEITINLLR